MGGTPAQPCCQGLLVSHVVQSTWVLPVYSVCAAVASTVDLMPSRNGEAGEASVQGARGHWHSKQAERSARR